MQILLAFYTLGSFRWEVLMLATASFPIYHQALINAFSGKEQKWHVTGAQGERSSPFNFIRPQVYLFTFLALTSVVAIWRDLNNAQLSLATGWNLTNTLVLGVFLLVALREGRTVATPAEGLRAAEPAVVEPPLDQVVRERARDLVPADAGSLPPRRATSSMGDLS
jgi:cellulose synthase (UDP-forming)